MNKRYSKKNRMRNVEFKEGDWAYRRILAPSTTRGPWEPKPFQISHIHHNQIIRDRDGQVSTSDHITQAIVDDVLQAIHDTGRQ